MVALLAASACSSPAPDRLVGADRLCPGSCDISFGYGFTEVGERERAAAEEAMAAWRIGTGSRVCFEPSRAPTLRLYSAVSNEAIAAIDARVAPSPGGQVAATQGTGTKWSEIWIIPSRVETYEDAVVIYLHELGHLLGLRHYEGPENSVMHAVADSYPGETSVPDRDLREYCRIHGCKCTAEH